MAVTGTFSTTDQVRQAVDDLIAQGHKPDEISAVTASGKPINNLNKGSVDEMDDLMKGAGIGALIGAGAGVLLAPLVIPGIGLLVAAGAFAAGGAIGGGLIGMLVESGHEEDEAQAIASEVKSGKYIVTLHTPDDPIMAETALRNAGAENVYVSTPRPSPSASQ